ncbi:hypothetical protein AB4099_33105 [Bosea sp. 2KB_26]|uniref:hypothetical protein n=1 Tax=Bosea sp. 2KB_26 TaxID=3237475 RepID=UPI003F937915
MSFGKRKLPAADPQRRNSDTQANYRGTAAGSGTLGIGLADIAIGVVAILASFSGAYFLLGRSSSPPRPTAPAVVASIGFDPAPVARSYNKQGTVPFIVGQSWMMTLVMEQTPDGFDAIDSELHERCMKPTSRDAAAYAEKRGQTFLGPEKGAEFLACTMRIYKNRFCDDQYRKRLVARLSEFVRARREHISLVKNVRESDMGRMIVAVDSANRGSGTDVTSGYQPSAFVPEPLAEQIRLLSRAGFVTQKDVTGLFSSTPDELKPYLQSEGKAPCG